MTFIKTDGRDRRRGRSGREIVLARTDLPNIAKTATLIKQIAVAPLPNRRDRARLRSPTPTAPRSHARPRRSPDELAFESEWSLHPVDGGGAR